MPRANRTVFPLKIVELILWLKSHSTTRRSKQSPCLAWSTQGVTNIATCLVSTPSNNPAKFPPTAGIERENRPTVIPRHLCAMLGPQESAAEFQALLDTWNMKSFNPTQTRQVRMPATSHHTWRTAVEFAMFDSTRVVSRWSLHNAHYNSTAGNYFCVNGCDRQMGRFAKKCGHFKTARSVTSVLLLCICFSTAL